MVYIRTQRQRCIYLLQEVLNIPFRLVPSYFTSKESDWRLVLSSLRVDRLEHDEAPKYRVIALPMSDAATFFSTEVSLLDFYFHLLNFKLFKTF